MTAPANFGDLRFRVRFDKQTEVSDPYGGTVSAWTEQFTRWATLRVEGGDESVQAQRLTGKIEYKMWVRKVSQTAQIESSWRGVVIKNDIPIQYLAFKTVDTITVRDWVYIKAEAGVADGG
jgi:SPP1 family predicted phage head-tail adaptor